jgi:hypothetical protein
MCENVKKPASEDGSLDYSCEWELRMKPKKKQRQQRAFAAHKEHRALRSKYATKKWTQANGTPPKPQTKAQRRGSKVP